MSRKFIDQTSGISFMCMSAISNSAARCTSTAIPKVERSTENKISIEQRTGGNVADARDVQSDTASHEKTSSVRCAASHEALASHGGVAVKAEAAAGKHVGNSNLMASISPKTGLWQMMRRLTEVHDPEEGKPTEFEKHT
jgi:hypothetical protein